MNLLLQFHSDLDDKTFQFDTNSMNTLQHELSTHPFASTMLECHIAVEHNGEELFETEIEFCGFNPELLIKSCRFYFYEKAWETFQSMLPKLSQDIQTLKVDEIKKEQSILCEYSKIYTLTNPMTISKIDETVDYLQSLEDSIRCGQVTFKDGLTDTNVDAKRFSTLYVASQINPDQSLEESKRIVPFVQIVIPGYIYDENQPLLSLFQALEQMIGYVNSICD